MKSIVKMIAIAIVGISIVGCSSKVDTEQTNTRELLASSKHQWIYNPDFDVDEGETCFTGAIKNNNDINDGGLIVKMLTSDLIGKMLAKVNNSKEVTVNRGGSNRRSTKEYGEYRSLTAEDVEISRLKPYIKNLEVINDQLVARLCSKGMLQRKVGDGLELPDELIEEDLSSFANKKR